MTQCVNNSLSNQNFTADGAVLALGQASFGTGSSNRLVNHYRVRRIGLGHIVVILVGLNSMDVQGLCSVELNFALGIIVPQNGAICGLFFVHQGRAGDIQLGAMANFHTAELVAGQVDGAGHGDRTAVDLNTGTGTGDLAVNQLCAFGIIELDAELAAVPAGLGLIGAGYRQILDGCGSSHQNAGFHSGLSGLSGNAGNGLAIAIESDGLVDVQLAGDAYILQQLHGFAVLGRIDGFGQREVIFFSNGSGSLAGIHFTADGALAVFILVVSDRNNSLGNQNFVTDRAVFAFGQAGCGAGGSNCCVNDLGVTQCIDLLGLIVVAVCAVTALLTFLGTGGFLSYDPFAEAVTDCRSLSLGNQYCITDRAVLAFGQTGCGTGSSNCLVNHFRVTGSRNNSLSNQNFAADGAVLAFGQASCGTGSSNCLVNHFRVTGSRNNSLSNQNFAADGAVLAFGQTGCGTGSSNCRINHFRVTLGFAFRGAAKGAGLGGGAGCVCPVMDTFAGPCAIIIFIGFRGTCCLGISTVRVFQLRRGYRNLGIACTLYQLIGNGCSTGIDLDRTISNTADIRTAGCGIQIARAGIQGACYLNGDIRKVCRGSGIGLARCIFDGDELLVRGAAEVAPIVAVVNIDADAICQLQGCAFVNDYLGARKHRKILSEGYGATLDIDGNVAVQGQFVVAGADAGKTNLQLDSGNGNIAVYIDHQTVGSAVIPLDKVSAGQAEHTAALSKEIHGGGEVHFGHIQAGISRLLGAGMQRQGHFDVLDVILGNGEYAIFHIGTLGAAAEIRKLEVFIDIGAAVCGNGAITGDEAPGIQAAAIVHGDGRAGFHPHKADISRGCATFGPTTLSNKELCGQAHAAIDDQIGAVLHGQSAVSLRCAIGRILCAVIPRFAGVQGISIVKGNQQGDAAGNGVVASFQHAVGCQHNRAALGHCVIQIVEQEAAGIKPCRTCCVCKNSLYGGICSNLKRVSCFFGDNGMVICLDPAQELAAVLRGGNQSCASIKGNVHGCVIGNRFSAHGDRAEALVIDEGHLGGFHRLLELEVGHLQLVLRAVFGGGNNDLETPSICQLLGKAAGTGIGSAINGQAIHIGSLPVKGKDTITAGIIGDGNGGCSGRCANPKEAFASLCRHRQSAAAEGFRACTAHIGSNAGHHGVAAIIGFGLVCLHNGHQTGVGFHRYDLRFGEGGSFAFADILAGPPDFFYQLRDGLVLGAVDCIQHLRVRGCSGEAADVQNSLHIRDNCMDICLVGGFLRRCLRRLLGKLRHMGFVGVFLRLCSVCCECVGRNVSDDHHNSQKHRQETGFPGMIHVFSSFIKTLSSFLHVHAGFASYLRVVQKVTQVISVLLLDSR